MSNVPESEIAERQNRLRAALVGQGLDGVFIIQNVALCYFSGTLQQAVLFVPVSGEPVLFVRRDIDRARADSAVKDIVPMKSAKDIARVLAERERLPLKAGLELDILPVNIFNKYREAFPTVSFSDASLLIRKLRMVKSPWEIGKITEAGRLMAEVLDELKRHVRPGVTELDIAYELEYIARRKGHMGLVRMRAFNQEMFYGHYLSGENAMHVSYVDSPTAGLGPGHYFPQGAGIKELKRGEPFSVDFVFVHEGYMVDQTRLFYLGEPSADARRIYAVAREIHRVAREKVKPGITCDELVLMVNGMVADAGLIDIFMGPAGKNVAYIGHGLGLELDELPLLAKGVRDRIEPGTVLALEPKFFLPGTGVLGIENTYLMGEEGLLLLTKSPEEIQIIK